MKIKRLLCAILAAIMVGVNLGGLIPVMAADEDPTIQNPDPVTLNDGVVLSKTVRSVPGYANKWEITLRIESPKTEKTSDTVIIIDRSGSMRDNNRLTEAKAAARSLAQQLLPQGNTTNRVAVVSFASSASNSGTGTGFTTNYNTVSNAIGRMNANGGTYTQAAIHMAADMLSESTADIKTIILLSDGEPTYSVPFTRSARNDDDNFVAYGNALETSSEVDQSVFNYSATGRVGDGGNLRECMQENWLGICTKYYNNGNSAIAEAGYYKATGNSLYAIGLEVEDDEDRDDDGADILSAIASSGKYYGNASPSDLTRIFNEIGGNILSLIQTASVADTMGHGVTVSGTDGETSINWTPEFKLEGNVFVAEKTYEVEMNEEVYNQTASGGFYALNESAVLTYNDGKTGEFPIPKAKPFDLDVGKELTVDGEEKIGEEFKFKISGNGTENTYSIKSGEDHIIPVPMPIKLGEEYTVTEIGIGSSGEIPFEYYDTPEYTIKYNGVESTTNKFTVTAEHGDMINIKIKNNYETTTVSAHKTWDDDNDRDGLRDDYDDLFVAVKDGNNYVAYEALSGDDKDYNFDGLHKNRNGQEINYTVVEAKGCSKSNDVITCSSEFSHDDNYTATIADGKITNKHTPKTKKIVIKKTWDVSGGNLPTSNPAFITVELSNDKGDDPRTIRLDGTGYGEWESDEISVPVYANHGETVTYTVTETGINGSNLNNESTLYVYNGKALEGKWTTTSNGLTVKNTWTPATPIYTGAGEFYIKKLDQDNQALSGVTFTVGNKTYTTGSDGKVKVGFSKSNEKPEDSYTFNITETDAPEYYDIIEGTEVLKATTNLDLTVSEENLTNTYTKSFTFEVKTPVDGYVWQSSDKTLLVTDQALAKDLKIEKTFEGITSAAFKDKSQISFTISGPNGFTETTVGINDDECKVSGSKLTCTIDGSKTLLPIGEYTVTENNADITNFTYTSEPTSGKVSQTVALGETAEFKFKNVYTPIKTASFKVKKVWEDDSDRDGIRPDELKVTLYAGDNAYGDPVKLKADNWAYEWTELPLVDENAETIIYSAKEAGISDYESDGGKLVNGVFTFTNTHNPETKKIVIKKTWDVSAGDLPTSNPTFITVELSNDKGDDPRTIRLDGTGYGEWESDEISVPVYANQGETITYSVKETGIDGSDLNNKATLYIYNGDVLEGKWVAESNDLTVKNTWTPATAHYEYDGASKFTIVKVDENNKALSGVVFNIGNSTKTTDSNGKIEMDVPISDTLAEEEIEYTISEKEAPEGYDPINDSVTITVTCTSKWSSASKETLLNIYTKTCEFKKSGSNEYTWKDPNKTLTVTNKRSQGGSLTIKKTFNGVDELAMKDLTFTITGPDDFGDNGEMTISFDDDCTVSDNVATCEVKGEIPTGEYTVKENNAELGDYELTVIGDNETQEVAKGKDVVFEIENNYELIETDPCANGGCGGGEEIVPPVTPDTGHFTSAKNSNTNSTIWINNLIGGAMTVLMGASTLIFSRRKETKLTK